MGKKIGWRPILPVTFVCNYNEGPIVLILPKFLYETSVRLLRK